MSPSAMLTHATRLDGWAADARREQEKCVTRGDALQANYWQEKARAFDASAAFWRENAATWANPALRTAEIRELAAELREMKGTP